MTTNTGGEMKKWLSCQVYGDQKSDSGWKMGVNIRNNAEKPECGRKMVVNQKE